MFLHLGGDIVVPKGDIIAIIDAKTKIFPSTREFMQIVDDEGFVRSVAGSGKEKSFVITTNLVYLSPISCATLKKRAQKNSYQKARLADSAICDII